LAQRLTAAKSEAATASWLAVEAGGQRYLFPLVQSGEIFSWAVGSPRPYTKPWYAGVASLRGGLHGVSIWAGWSSEPPMRVQLTERVTSESRLVSLHGALGSTPFCGLTGCWVCATLPCSALWSEAPAGRPLISPGV
jgi:twitching motility protein PilI